MIFSECNNIHYVKKNKEDILSKLDTYGRNILFYDIPFSVKKFIVENLPVYKNHVDNYGNTALFYVKTKEDAELLLPYIDIDHKNNEGETALFYSNLEISEWLIKNDINIQERDKNGNNAAFMKDLSFSNLCRQAVYRDKDCKKIKLLIENGIDIGNVNFQGKNILFSGHDFKSDFYDYLESQKINFNQCPDDTEHFLLGYGRYTKNINLLSKKIINKIDFSFIPKEGNKKYKKPLLFFLINKWKNKDTLSAVQNINEIQHKGFNILSEVEKLSLFKFIIKNTHIDINKRNQNNENLLYCDTLNIDKVKFLLTVKIDVNIQNNENKSPFFYHIDKYNQHVQEKHKFLKYKKKYESHAEIAFEILGFTLGLQNFSQDLHVLSLISSKKPINKEEIDIIMEYVYLNKAISKEGIYINKKKLRI